MAQNTTKKLALIKRSTDRHWVGDGFPVRTVFSYNDLAKELSPFLLLDYAGPVQFPPTNKRLGVGEHPHRGFETVTIVYDGEVEHRDSSGGGGIINAGDVQWMTAGGGLVHEEFHGPNLRKAGGLFEVVQLWVNLAAKDKMTKPGYQGITKDQIPSVDLPDGAGQVRVIAGGYDGKGGKATTGPAHTFSPMNVWDLRLKAGKRVTFALPDGDTTALFLLKGALRVIEDGQAGQPVGEAELALFERAGESITVEALSNTTVLLLAGTPFDEPVVGYGPFVMNSQAEIRQAVSDYQSGKMGHLAQDENASA
jgi:redox-sensitive bicupin YhaK (pirin superfamily)